MTSPARNRFVVWVRRVVSNGQDPAVADAASRAAAIAPDRVPEPDPATAPAAVTGPPVWGTASGSPTPARHDLIDGLTSVELARRVRRTNLVMSVAVIAVALFVLLAVQPSNPVIVALLVFGAPVFGIISSTSNTSAQVSRRRREEHLAGYTLTRTSRRDLDQVDPATGYVIRRRGEPALTLAQQRAAIAALKPSSR